MNTRKFKLRPVAQALAMGSALAVAPLAGHAVIIQFIEDSSNSSATVTGPAGGTSSTVRVSPQVDISAFDRALGVLMRATTLGVTSTRLQTTTVTSNNPDNGHTSKSVSPQVDFSAFDGALGVLMRATTLGVTSTRLQTTTTPSNNKPDNGHVSKTDEQDIAAALEISGRAAPLTQSSGTISQSAGCTSAGGIGCPAAVGPSGAAQSVWSYDFGTYNGRLLHTDEGALHLQPERWPVGTQLGLDGPHR